MASDHRYEFGILGPLVVRQNGVELELGSQKQRALLALLLIDANEVLTVDRIIDALWGETPPSNAKASLQFHVSKLRKALEPDRPRGAPSSLVATHAQGYRLAVDPKTIDTHSFEDQVRRAQAELASDPAGATASLRTALGMWRGPALADVAYESFAQHEIRRLDELRLAAVESRIEAELALGEHRRLIPELQNLVTHHPLRERLTGHLMLALYRDGRQSEALGAYRDVQRALSEDLGIEPSLELQHLENEILLQSTDLSMERPRPSSESMPGPVHDNLPARLAAFIGRRNDLTEVRGLLPGARLVTLTGPAGVGKTSLAIELSRALSEDYTHGVWLVDLAPTSDKAAVLATVATMLDVRDDGQQPLEESIAGHLRTKHILLVLDNCEHVLEPAADLTRVILAAAPRLAVLATSRTRMGISGETVWGVAGLPTPDQETAAQRQPMELRRFDAVALFEARAAAARPGFELDDSTASVVAELCRQLDGLPLAIELAASQIATSSPQEVLASLSSQSRMLDGAVIRGERHDTLAEAIDWSYRMLSEAEQLAFCRLGVFRGAFDADAASAILDDPAVDAAAVPGLLRSLVERSMVTIERRYDRSRFRLLETLKTYARDILDRHGELASFRRRHAEHFTQLALELTPDPTPAGVVFGSPSKASIDRFDVDREEFNAALDWAVTEEEMATAVDLIGLLNPFWWHRSVTREALERSKAVLGRSALPATPSLARALIGAASLGLSFSDLTWVETTVRELRVVAAHLDDDDITLIADFAEAHLIWRTGFVPDAAASLRNQAERARAGDHEEWLPTILTYAGLALADAGDLEGADRCAAMLSIDRAATDLAFRRMVVHSVRGQIAYIRGDLAEALAEVDAMIRLARSVRDREFLCYGLQDLAVITFDSGDVKEAHDLALQARDLAERSAHAEVLARCRVLLARVAITEGDNSAAGDLIRGVLTTPGVAEDRRTTQWALLAAAELAVGEGRNDDAIHLYAATDHQRRQTGVALPAPIQAALAANLAALRAACGHHRYEAAWGDGWNTPVSDAVNAVTGAAHSG